MEWDDGQKSSVTGVQGWETLSMRSGQSFGRDVAETALIGAGDSAGRLRSRYALDQGGQVADEPVVEPAVGVAF